MILLLDQAYEDYETGLVALRRRVVANMRRKVKESGILDDPCEGSVPRSALLRKR